MFNVQNSSNNLGDLNIKWHYLDYVLTWSFMSHHNDIWNWVIYIDLNLFLNIIVARYQHDMFLSQKKKYAIEILDMANMLNLKVVCMLADTLAKSIHPTLLS